VEGEALATLVVNKLRGGLKVAAVKAPGFWRSPQVHARGHRDPQRRPADLEDLGIKLENVTLQMLGRAKKVIIEKEKTTIVDGAGKKEGIGLGSARSRRRSRETPPTTTARSCRSGWRSSRRVAVIRVGGATEIESRREGPGRGRAQRDPRRGRGRHVPGGGVRCSARAKPWTSCSSDNPDIQAGSRSCGARWKVADPPESRKTQGRRLDRGRQVSRTSRRPLASSPERDLCDMVEAGSSIRQKWSGGAAGWASVAGLLITTEAMVAELPKDKSAALPCWRCGMGGMDF